MTAEDADSNADIAFAIEAVSSNGGDVFMLTGTNPAMIEVSGALDRTVAKRYILTVKVYNPDDATYSNLQTLTILVANENVNAPAACS